METNLRHPLYFSAKLKKNKSISTEPVAAETPALQFLPLNKLLMTLSLKKGKTGLPESRVGMLKNLLVACIRHGHDQNETTAKALELLVQLPISEGDWDSVANQILVHMKKEKTFPLELLFQTPLSAKDEAGVALLNRMTVLMSEAAKEDKILPFRYLQSYFSWDHADIPKGRKKNLGQLLADVIAANIPATPDSVEAMKLFATMPVSESLWQTVYKGLVASATPGAGGRTSLTSLSSGKDGMDPNVAKWRKCPEDFTDPGPLEVVLWYEDEKPKGSYVTDYLKGTQYKVIREGTNYGEEWVTYRRKTERSEDIPPFESKSGWRKLDTFKRPYDSYYSEYGDYFRSESHRNPFPDDLISWLLKKKKGELHVFAESEKYYYGAVFRGEVNSRSSQSIEIYRCGVKPAASQKSVYDKVFVPNFY